MSSKVAVVSTKYIIAIKAILKFELESYILFF